MTTEVRFAFALNGGVSLAIWIGGVVDEVLRLVDGGKRAASGETDSSNPYIALCAELEVTPKVDVLAGSSAGGLNAAFLATAVIYGCSDMRPIKQLWLDYGSFDVLLRSPDHASLISLLNGDENFLPQIEAAFRYLAENGTGFTEVDPPVSVRLTATSLRGKVTTIADGLGSISSVDHRAEFAFETRDFNFAADADAVTRLARACRSTASFPGAFEPSDVPTALYESRHIGGLFDDVTEVTVPFVDGAILVNLPAKSAIDAIIRQPSHERTERVLALVVPDPSEVVEDDGAIPTFNDVVSKSILGIPRTQSLSDFVLLLNEHNEAVRSRRIALDAMLMQFATLEPNDAWTRLEGVSNALFGAYQATRPNASGDWAWDATTVARLAAKLTTWINDLAVSSTDAVARDLYRLKERISLARSNADRVATDADRAISAQLDALAACFDDFIRMAVTQKHPTVALQGLIQLHHGAGSANLARLLLALEVIEHTFSGLAPRPDQEIRLVQFTAKSPVAIDALQRREPIDKLAGVELAHFGAFLKRSWRANDWMWGRLDAAERLVRLLDTVLDGHLTAEGSLERHTRGVQAAVLREELPTMVNEIEEDARRGARLSEEGRAFCRAVRASVNTPAGPVDLSGLTDDELQQLLSLQLVGAENLQMEVGSDLAKLTAVSALATASGVMRAQGPRLLRAPIGILGTASLFAWRLSLRRRGKQIQRAQSAVVFLISVLGLVGTTVHAAGFVALGSWRFGAWALLLVSPVAATFLTPWLLVGLGPRAIRKT